MASFDRWQGANMDKIGNDNDIATFASHSPRTHYRSYFVHVTRYKA
jgi:hypothetical protein